MLLSALQELSALLGSRAATAPTPDDAAKAQTLKGHVDEFLIPRVIDLDAPLLTVILGPTGSGKSSLFNAIAGAALSEVGVLRPTTRRAHVLVPPGSLLPTAISKLLEEDTVEILEHPAALEHLALVDAPDFDSIEEGNRILARRLLEAADLIVFMTTDTRYADDIPWRILSRARERGVPMLTVINRLPGNVRERTAVMGDYQRLLREGGFADLHAGGSFEVVGVDLGETDTATSGLRREAVEPVMKTLQQLVDDDAGRRDLVRTSMLTAVRELPKSIEEIIREIDEEDRLREDLLGVARSSYHAHRSEVDERIDRGTFLRTEVLREWQDFVGANRVARVVAEGVGKVAATIRSLFRPGPAPPAPEIRDAAFADLIGLVRAEADRAAAETAGSWARLPFGSEAVGDHPDLWGVSPALPEALGEALSAWGGRITRDIMEVGEKRRGLAKSASLGVNVVGTGAILAVFAQTGGLTGAEAGIAAVTAVVNQTLLEAIFGEANVARFVAKARESLDEAIDEIFEAERQRFEAALGLSPQSGELADRLRTAVASLAEESP